MTKIKTSTHNLNTSSVVINGLYICVGKLTQALCFQSLSVSESPPVPPVFSASISLHSLYILAHFVFEAYRRGLFKNIARLLELP